MSDPTPADIESLVELFERSDWEEMHLKTDGLEIFLSNDPAARAPSEAAGAPAAASAPPAAPSAPPRQMATPVVAHDVVVPDGMIAVRAPNLGTFYRAPKPGAPPYVEVGQKITADTEVCLIEVMKLFTPVKAGVDGIVRDVCADDGQMVEFEQVLVIVEPTA